MICIIVNFGFHNYYLFGYIVSWFYNIFAFNQELSSRPNWQTKLIKISAQHVIKSATETGIRNLTRTRILQWVVGSVLWKHFAVLIAKHCQHRFAWAAGKGCVDSVISWISGTELGAGSLELGVYVCSFWRLHKIFMFVKYFLWKHNKQICISSLSISFVLFLP